VLHKKFAQRASPSQGESKTETSSSEGSPESRGAHEIPAPV
jgi:hypothetical protein